MYAILGKRAFHPQVWKSDKRSVAGGLAVGLFTAFTPTIPFQMLLAAAGAILFKVNLPLALAACWVTNPFTAVPIYVAARELGRHLLTRHENVSAYVMLFVPVGQVGRFIREGLYLTSGSLVFATLASTGGYLAVMLLFKIVDRIEKPLLSVRGRALLNSVLRSLVPLMLLWLGYRVHKNGWATPASLYQMLSPLASAWWAPLLIIGIMAAMFTLALPGSLLIVLAGIFYTPLAATAMAVAGGVIGSTGGFFLARACAPVFTDRFADCAPYRAMQSRTGFPTLFTLRVLPGMPHAVVNYSAGLLNVPRLPFALSTALGFAVKGLLYASAAHDVSRLRPGQRMLSVDVLWPFAALALLAVTALYVERRLLLRRSAHAADALPAAETMPEADG